jgi:hypothetical protein
MHNHKTYLLVNEQKEDDFYIFEEVLSVLNKMYIFITQTKPESNSYVKLKFMEGDIDSAEAFSLVKEDLIEAIQRKGYKLLLGEDNLKACIADYPWVRAVLNQTSEYIENQVTLPEAADDFITHETSMLRKLRL